MHMNPLGGLVSVPSRLDYGLVHACATNGQLKGKKRE